MEEPHIEMDVDLPPPEAEGCGSKTPKSKEILLAQPSTLLKKLQRAKSVLIPQRLADSSKSSSTNRSSSTNKSSSTRQRAGPTAQLKTTRKTRAEDADPSSSDQEDNVCVCCNQSFFEKDTVYCATCDGRLNRKHAHRIPKRKLPKDAMKAAKLRPMMFCSKDCRRLKINELDDIATHGDE